MKMRSAIAAAVLLPAIASAAPEPAAGLALHHGGTFEANLGIGWPDGARVQLAGGLAAGGWLTSTVALTGRITGLTNGVGGRIGVIGPSVQYWVSEQAWLAAGAGLAFMSVAGSDSNVDDDPGSNGLGIDLRAGYAFTTTWSNPFNASIELTHDRYSIRDRTVTHDTFALMLGVQFQ